MKLWGYYAFHTFINAIRKMFRSTVIIIIASCLGIGLIFGLAIGIIGSVLEEQGQDSTEISSEMEDYETGDEEYDDLEEEPEAELTEEDIKQIKLVVEAGVGLLVLLLLGIGAYTGRKKGSDIFTMADVNFLFTSPLKPQSVLLFRLSFQMLATFTGCLYVLFQIPNLVLNVGLPLWVCILGFGALVIAIIFQKLVSVGMYTLTATNPKVGKFVLPVLIGIVAVVLLGTGATYLLCGQDIWRTLELTWASDWSSWIPIIGWIKAMVMNAVEGNTILVVLQLILLLLAMVAMVYFFWQMKADFYEDAMAGAQKREELLLAAAENRQVVTVNDDKKKKKDKRKVKEEGLKGTGASVFFTKEMVCRKRLAKFGILTTTMEWYLVISIVGAIVCSKFLEMNSFEVIGFVLMVVLFFRNYVNPIAQETSRNWLFMVPESPYKKVFYAMAAGSYATFVDLLPGVIIAFIILGANPLQFLLWMAVFLTMDFMLSGVGMVLEALFPADAMNQIKASLQLLLKFFMILVIVIAILIGTLIGGITCGLVVNLIVNMVLGALTFLIYPSMLHDGIA